VVPALKGLQTSLGRLRQGIARLIDSYAEGSIDKTEFDPRIARMRERIKHVEEQVQQIQDQESFEQELQLIIGQLETFTAKVNDGLHTADWLTRREIIRTLVKRVEVDQEKVTVVFRVGPHAPPSPSDTRTQNLQHCRGRDHTALWASAQGFVIAPLLHISSLEQVSYEPEKPIVVYLFS
jgi:site-specific DNA recombinase